jgi:hypothetical protein
METGNYYLLNNETGKRKRVNKTGEYIKKFNVNMTGKLSYTDRLTKANGLIKIKKQIYIYINKEKKKIKI